MSKHFFVFTLIFLYHAQCSFAQNQFKDSSQVKDYWAKHGTVRLVYAYMEDQQDQTDKEEEGMHLYRDLFLNDEFFYEAVSKVLRSYNWGNTDSMVFKPLISKINGEYELNQSFFEIESSTGGAYSSENWQKTVETILADYSNSLQNLQKTTNKDELFGSLSLEKSNFNYLHFIFIFIFFIVGFALGVLFFYLYFKHKVFLILKNDLQFKPELYSAKKGLLNIIVALKDRKEHYKQKNENEDLSKQKTDLKKEIENLTKEKSELKKLVKQPDTNSNPENIKKNIDGDGSDNVIENKLYETIFFSMPEINGSFQIQHGETNYDEKKYFKIIHEKSSETGELHYISSDRDKRAINRLDSYLLPVSDIEDISFASDATGVELTNPGKVFLKDDRWVIDPDNKLKLKLY